MLAEYKWLERATSKIRFGPDRKAVGQELYNHIEDLRNHYAEQGMTPEAAMAAALEAMGDPESISEDLGRIHRPWLGYLWRASQSLLIASVCLCVILGAAQIFLDSAQAPLEHFPGWEIYDYLTWEFEAIVDEPTQYELVPTGTVTTGGYTIRPTHALMRRSGDPAQAPQYWNLVLQFHIAANWRGEELYWGPNTVTEVRDSAGNTYGGWTSESEKYCYYDSSAAAPLLGQKAALELNDVPEDTAWIELDLGYGTLRRTLRIDLKEAAT